MLATQIHRYPFLRMVAPLIAGIVCGDITYSLVDFPSTGLFFVLLLLFSGLIIGVSAFVQSYRWRWVFGVVQTLGWFVLGAALICYHLNRSTYDFSDKKEMYRVVLAETPVVKEKSVQCKVHLLCMIDSLSSVPVDKQVLLYLKKDSQSRLLTPGDELIIYSQFTLPRNKIDIDDFDYGRYLQRRGIAATAYVDSLHWHKVGHQTNQSLSVKATQLRNQIVNMYRHLGFFGENLAVLSALTIGHKEELGIETREAYSIAGASHLLAISGMHVGLLCTILLFATKWLSSNKKLIILFRVAVVLALLWVFAFVVGFTPSVVRATCMFSFLLMATVFSRDGINLNILAATAFCMLLFSPAWIFDIGFQLSFCAVLSILLLQPFYIRWFKISNKAVRYLANVIFVSLAAQIGVMPLLLFYFSRFSTHFLLTNILIVPLMAFIIPTALVMMILFFLPYVQYYVAYILNLLLTLMNQLIHWVEQLPYASLDGIWIHAIEVVLLYALFLCLLLGLYRQTGRRVILILSVLLCFCSVHLFFTVYNRPPSSVSFYNINSCPMVHCVSANRQSWLVMGDEPNKGSNVPKSILKHCSKMRMGTPQLICTDYKDDVLHSANQIVQFYHCRIGVVNDSRWDDYVTTSPLLVDYLYICKGYNGKLEELLQLFNAKTIVLDSSLPMYKQVAYKAHCKRLKIPFISLFDKGSAMFLL